MAKRFLAFPHTSSFLAPKTKIVVRTPAYKTVRNFAFLGVPKVGSFCADLVPSIACLRTLSVSSLVTITPRIPPCPKTPWQQAHLLSSWSPAPLPVQPVSLYINILHLVDRTGICGDISAQAHFLRAHDSPPDRSRHPTALVNEENMSAQSYQILRPVQLASHLI